MTREKRPREKRRTTDRLSRRSYLKLAGGAAASLAAVGISGTAAAQATGKTVDIVEAGADDTGSTPIDDVLRSVVAPNTTIEFPRGTYRLNGFSADGLSNVAFVGTGASLVPPDGSTGAILSLSGTNVTVEGFTFDYTAPNTAAQMSITCTDGLVLRDLDFVGQADVSGGSGSSGHEYHLTPSVSSSGGTGLIQNVSLADGAMNPSNRGGIWMGPNNQGTMVFDGLHMEQWANNSLYCKASSGPVIVKNSLFRNNNVSGPRIGANGSKVLNTTLISDGDVPVQAFTGGLTSRGIWIEDACEDVLIEGCDFVMSGPHASGGIVYQVPGTNANVRDCRFKMDVDQPAIDCGVDGSPLTIDTISVTGGAGNGDAIYLNGRDGSQISNACIQQPNGSRGGVRVENASNCTIADSTINVAGQTVSSNARTQNISETGTCPLPKPKKV